jgi:hypothetical protein
MLNRDFSDLLSAFAHCGVEYLLVGAHALSAHGYVRATADLDVFVRPSAENASAVRKALLMFGAPAELISEQDLVQPDQVIQLGVAPVRIDVLTGLTGVTFDEAWDARLEIQLGDTPVPVIGREQLIANKRATGRPRDLLDVEWLEGRGTE